MPMTRQTPIHTASGPDGIWRRNAYIVLVLVSIVFLVLDRARPERSPFLPGKHAVMTLMAPAMAALSAPLRTLNQASLVLASNWHAASRLRQLEADKRNLLYWRDLALALQEKMLRYEKLLHAPDAPRPVVVTARIVSDSGGPFVRTRLVNAGTADRVARGQAVLAYNGLIGRVMAAGQHSARVLLLTDYNSRVPVFVAQTGAHAILAGDNSPVPRLDYIARGARMKAGMRVMTSGEDGVLPRGIAVGQVVPAEPGRWRVRLYANPGNADFATILALPAVPPVQDGKVAADVPVAPASPDTGSPQSQHTGAAADSQNGRAE